MSEIFNDLLKKNVGWVDSDGFIDNEMKMRCGRASCGSGGVYASYRSEDIQVGWIGNRSGEIKDIMGRYVGRVTMDAFIYDKDNKYVGRGHKSSFMQRMNEEDWQTDSRLRTAVGGAALLLIFYNLNATLPGDITSLFDKAYDEIKARQQAEAEKHQRQEDFRKANPGVGGWFKSHFVK